MNMHARASRSETLIVVPAMLHHLGDVRGKAVLCLGCGAGQELELGAGGLVGVDQSEGLLQECRKRQTGARLIRADLGDYVPPKQRFDVVYASMSLQYVSNLDEVLRRVHDALRDGGRLVYAVPHSVYYGAEWEQFPGGERLTLGWEVKRSDDGADELLLRGNYLEERLQSSQLQGELEVWVWVCSVSRILQALIDAGFDLRSVDEPTPREPSEAVSAADGLLIARRHAIPLILAGSALRR